MFFLLAFIDECFLMSFLLTVRSITNSLLPAVYLKRFVVLHPKSCDNNIYMIKKKDYRRRNLPFLPWLGWPLIHVRCSPNIRYSSNSSNTNATFSQFFNKYRIFFMSCWQNASNERRKYSAFNNSVVTHRDECLSKNYNKIACYRL